MQSDDVENVEQHNEGHGYANQPKQCAAHVPSPSLDAIAESASIIAAFSKPNFGCRQNGTACRS
jgi:hypothetical protein